MGKHFIPFENEAAVKPKYLILSFDREKTHFEGNTESFHYESFRCYAQNDFFHMQKGERGMGDER